MAIVLPGWFDDSERDDGRHAVAALGGCVGTAEQWKIQDGAWMSDVLEPFGLTEVGFHTKMLNSERGAYAKFKNNRPLRLDLSMAILGTFKKSEVRPFAAMTRLTDLRRFNRERGRGLNAYALNIYTCMSYVQRCFPKQLTGGSFAQMNLDKSGNKTGPAIEIAEMYAKTHPDSPAVTNVHVVPTREGMAHCTPALQAADFVVGEARRFVEQWQEFYDERPDGESTQDLRNALTKWTKETGRKETFERGSMRALMSSKPWVTLHAWHFNSLCAFDHERQGIWALEKTK